ncbi:hypothetical protein TNCV_2204581 [Trichonephila clavipes]|nr:hypothetical protein TNCV_2204581 [Trichonephila clavipes]
MLFPNWLTLVRGNKSVPSGYRRMWVCLQNETTHELNETALELAEPMGCDLPHPSSCVLSHSEIHPLHRVKMNLAWQIHPAHHWYTAKSPDRTLQCRISKASSDVLGAL